MKGLTLLLSTGGRRYQGLVHTFRSRAMSSFVKAAKVTGGMHQEEEGEGTPKGSLPIGDIPNNVQQADVVDISDDGCARITLPGLSAANFSRTGKLSLKGIHNIFLTGSWAIRRHSDFTGFRRLYKENFTVFMLAIDVHVHRDFHDVIKNKWLHLPMDFHEYNYRVGKTSYTFDRMLRDQSTMTAYAEASDTWVVVDWKTRRPLALPDWFRNQFPTPAEPETSMKSNERYVPASPGDRRFTTSIEVVPSDADSNGHVTQSEYVRYVMDCAATACQQQFYGNFSGDIYEWEVARQQLLYTGEARVGQTLEVVTWEDEADVNVLHFLVNNAKGKASLHCKTTFYPL